MFLKVEGFDTCFPIKRWKLSIFYEYLIHALGLKIWRVWILTALISAALISAQQWGIKKNWCGEPTTAKLASNREKRKSCLVGHGQRQVWNWKHVKKSKMVIAGNEIMASSLRKYLGNEIGSIMCWKYLDC